MHVYGTYTVHFNIILSSGLWFSNSRFFFCSRFPVFCKHVTVSAYLKISVNTIGLCSATSANTATLKLGVLKNCSSEFA